MTDPSSPGSGDAPQGPVRAGRDGPKKALLVRPGFVKRALAISLPIIVLLVVWLVPVRKTSLVYCPHCGETGTQTTILWFEPSTKADGNLWQELHREHSGVDCRHQWYETEFVEVSLIGWRFHIADHWAAKVARWLREGGCLRVLQEQNRTAEIRLALELFPKLWMPDSRCRCAQQVEFTNDLLNGRYEDPGPLADQKAEADRLCRAILAWEKAGQSPMYLRQPPQNSGEGHE